MAVTEFSRTGYLNGANEPTTWHGRGFGITLEANAPFPGLPVCETAGGRVTTWHEEHPQAIDEAWELDDGSVLVDMRHTDGRLFMRIDSHVSAGYRIWAPYYGRHLVSADGRSIRSALPNVTPWRWQRLFFAQALPLAAALQGLEVFHASAVALRGRVLAFVGAPGAGKTSVAAHLVTLGAKFVTDDVLAIEPGPEGVRAHPGPARLSIDDAELRRIPPIQQARVGAQVGRSDKLMLEPTPVEHSLQLAHLYFLRRAADSSRIHIVEPNESSARALLGSGTSRCAQRCRSRSGCTTWRFRPPAARARLRQRCLRTRRSVPQECGADNRRRHCPPRILRRAEACPGGRDRIHVWDRAPAAPQGTAAGGPRDAAQRQPATGRALDGRGAASGAGRPPHLGAPAGRHAVPDAVARADRAFGSARRCRVAGHRRCARRDVRRARLGRAGRPSASSRIRAGISTANGALTPTFSHLDAIRA